MTMFYIERRLQLYKRYFMQKLFHIDISVVSFTDGAGNTISIGYCSDKINVRFKISENVDNEFNLYTYLTDILEKD